MSYQDTYLPDGFAHEYESSLRREEAYDLALAAAEVRVWDSAIDPLIADDLANHHEVGFEVIGSLLCLAAYAKTMAGKADREFICDRLVALFESDVERVARFEVAEEGY